MIGMVQKGSLLAVKSDGVSSRLRDRAATTQSQTRKRVGATAAKARRSIAVGDPNRAEEAEVVQVQNRPRPGLPCRRQRPPAEQGVQIVSMDHLCPQAANGVSHLFWIHTAGCQRARGAKLPRLSAGPLQHLNGMTAPG